MIIIMCVSKVQSWNLLVFQSVLYSTSWDRSQAELYNLIRRLGCSFMLVITFTPISYQCIAPFQPTESCCHSPHVYIPKRRTLIQVLLPATALKTHAWADNIRIWGEEVPVWVYAFWVCKPVSQLLWTTLGRLALSDWGTGEHKNWTLVVTQEFNDYDCKNWSS